MLLVDLIAGARVVTGAALMLIAVIGLALTRIEERGEKEDTHEREDQ